MSGFGLGTVSGFGAGTGVGIGVPIEGLIGDRGWRDNVDDRIGGAGCRVLVEGGGAGCRALVKGGVGGRRWGLRAAPPIRMAMKNSTDISKVKALGWAPGISLAQGLPSVVEWYRNNRQLKTNTTAQQGARA